MTACFTSKYSISIVGKEVGVEVCGGGGPGRGWRNTAGLFFLLEASLVEIKVISVNMVASFR